MSMRLGVGRRSGARRVRRIGPARGGSSRTGALENLRHGRVQRLLAGVTAASAPPLALEVYLEHYKGSFSNPWEWAPIALTPLLTAAGAAGVASERAARTALPLTAALFGACGLLGTVLHARGVLRRPGGAREPLYNLVMGPPLLAPGSLALVGALGVLAAAVPRER
ncbi:MAG TPA: hypothetical protein VGL54_11300 [Solirubrobacteraceae bacterium]